MLYIMYIYVYLYISFFLTTIREANNMAHYMGKEPARPSKCPNMLGAGGLSGIGNLQPLNAVNTPVGVNRKKKVRDININNNNLDPFAQQQVGVG